MGLAKLSHPEPIEPLGAESDISVCDGCLHLTDDISALRKALIGLAMSLKYELAPMEPESAQGILAVEEWAHRG